jgi:hypothetical protein
MGWGIAAHSRPDRPSTRDLEDGARHVIDVMQAHIRHGEIKGSVSERELGRICEHDRRRAGVTAGSLHHGR